MIRKLVFIILLSNFVISAQPVTNSEIASGLIEKSIMEFPVKPDLEKPLQLVYHSPDRFSFYKNSVTRDFLKRYQGLKINERSQDERIEYTIENLVIVYSEPFSDGFLGEQQFEREINLRGGMLYYSNGELKESSSFNLFASDSIALEQKDYIDSPGLKVSSDGTEAESFLSGVTGPAIAVGATLVSLFLFFTVRSK